MLIYLLKLLELTLYVNLLFKSIVIEIRFKIRQKDYSFITLHIHENKLILVLS